MEGIKEKVTFGQKFEQGQGTMYVCSSGERAVHAYQTASTKAQGQQCTKLDRETESQFGQNRMSQEEKSRLKRSRE